MLTRDRVWSLPEVLKALRSLDYDRKLVRVVFVDRHSGDGTRQLLDEFAADYGDAYEAVEVVSSDSGISAARNECVSRSSGTEYVFFLDSDVVPGPKAAVRLLSHFDRAGVGIASLPYDSENSRGKLGPLVGAFATPTGPADAYKVAAGCTMISAAVFREVGGFNERLRVLEDGEFCFRARRAGFGIVCDFGYPARHLREVNMGARSYLGFAADSAAFYIELARQGSRVYQARYALSAALFVSAAALVASPSIPWAMALLGSLVLSVAVNSSDRLWGDGSRIRFRYKPLAGLAFTAATLLVAVASVGVLAGRFLRRGRPPVSSRLSSRA